MKYCPKCNNIHNKPGIFCSRSCSNSRSFSTEAIEKKSLANKAWATSNPEVAKLNAKRASDAFAAKSTNIKRYCITCNKQITKENKSGLCKKHFEESPVKDEYTGRRKQYIRKKVHNKWTNTEVLLLSSLEIRFYEKLEGIGTKWIKPSYITYVTNDSVSHRYFPDFYLPDTNQYIEVKGYYWPSDKIKMGLVREQNPELDIRIVFEKDIEQW